MTLIANFIISNFLLPYGQNYNSEEVIQVLDSLEEIIQDCQPLGSPEGPLMKTNPEAPRRHLQTR